MPKAHRIAAQDRPRLRLRTLRKAKGFSQTDVAEALDKDQSAIARWERGEAEPRLSELLLLAKLYGCALGNLVEDGDGLSDDERQLIGSLRANPLHKRLVLSQVAVLQEASSEAKKD